MSKVVEALGVTYAAVGQEISDAAMMIIAKDLSAYAEADVLEALSRCRRELRRIALVDILERMPGGHPGPEEAWAIVAPALADERVTFVQTDQIANAFGVALHLADNPIAARMAFMERYRDELRKARNAGETAIWRPSLGWDREGREGPLAEAVRLGRLGADHVAGLLPNWEASDCMDIVKTMAESMTGKGRE